MVEQLAEENQDTRITKARTNVNNVYQALSKKEMTEEDKKFVSETLKRDPDFLIKGEFLAKIAPLDMNRCPDSKGGCLGYIAKSAQQLEATSLTLANIDALTKEGLLENKGGKTPVQHMLDNGRLPNGEIMGTQTVKNVIYLRALQNDEKYADNADVSQYLSENQDFLGKMYRQNEYGANPNRRNYMGQKVGEIMDSHLDKDSKARTLTVKDLQTKPYQKTKALSREELEVGAYQGTLTAEQMDELNHLRDSDKKEGEVHNVPGDPKREKREQSKDSFTDEDVVKYLYEEWLLKFASWSFNKIEEKFLDVIDAAGGYVVERAVARRARRKKDKENRDGKLNDAKARVDDFIDIFSAVNRAKKDGYSTKETKYKDMFADLEKVIADRNYKSQYNFDEGFIEKLRQDPHAKDFIKAGQERVASMVGTLKITDQLGLLMAQIDMTDKMMKDENSWNKDGKPMSREDLAKQLTRNAQANQVQLLNAISVISEDSRLIAEMAWEKLLDKDRAKLNFNDFIQGSVNKDVNAFIEGVTQDVQKAAKLQQKEVEAGHFKEQGSKNGPSDKVSQNLSSAKQKINSAVENGKVYDQAEFKEEKSAERIQTLREAAESHNEVSFLDKVHELNTLGRETLETRRNNVDKRRADLAKYKERLEARDGKQVVDKQISSHVKNAQNLSGRS